MKRLSLWVLACSLVLSVAVFAQGHQHDHAAAPAKSAKLDKAYLQRVCDAWTTLDPKNAEMYYPKSSEHVFYDIAPLKYQGWAAYQKGAAELLKTVKSMTMKVNDDAQITHEGNMAWSTATLDFSMTGQDGKTVTMPLRWTAIWHNHGGNWIIAHEQVSAPLPSGPPKQ